MSATMTDTTSSSSGQQPGSSTDSSAGTAAGPTPAAPGGPAGAVAGFVVGGWRRFRSLPLPMRLTAYVALALVLLLVLATATATVLVRRPLPQTSGVVEVAGLDGEVEVLRDEHGIAQIYADTMGDLAIREQVAWFGCPANALDGLKERADAVAPSGGARGVVELLAML